MDAEHYSADIKLSTSAACIEEKINGGKTLESPVICVSCSTTGVTCAHICPFTAVSCVARAAPIEDYRHFARVPSSLHVQYRVEFPTKLGAVFGDRLAGIWSPGPVTLLEVTCPRSQVAASYSTPDIREQIYTGINNENGFYYFLFIHFPCPRA